MRQECQELAALPDMVHVAGAIALVDAPIRWTRIRRLAMGLRAPCCKCRAHVQITTSLVAIVTTTDAGGVLVSGAMPDAMDPRTLRFCPYIKVRVQTCRYARPIWIDVGRTIVVPWDTASVSIMIPETVSANLGVANVPAQWLIDPLPNVTEIPQPIAGNSQFWEAWIWVSQKCTRCCEPQDAILTDSHNGGSMIFQVPPGADQVEVVAGETGATVTLLWLQGDGTVAGSSVLGQSALGSAAFGIQVPQCVCVAPGTTHVMITTDPADIPCLLAWRVRL